MNALYWQMAWVIEAILLLAALGIYFARREHFARLERQLLSRSNAGDGDSAIQVEFDRMVAEVNEAYRRLKESAHTQKERALQRDVKHK